MEREYRICSKTVMDTVGDEDIRFDDDGVCNYYHVFTSKLKFRVPSVEEGEKQLKIIVEKIKKDGIGKNYDCVIGISGGVDSTYTAWYVKPLGLRPIAVHLDNGWNSELAVKNIENILNKLEIDLYTKVLDWEMFKDLQLSFLRASTPDGEIPTDHAIYAVTMNVAAKYGIKYIISGSNIKTEGILPRTWARGHLDWKYIKAVTKIFGTKELKSFPHITMSRVVYYLYLKNIKSIPILNYTEYNKSKALEILKSELDWQYYGGKHYESVYTRFFQGYILPQKFNIDKRRGHLSTLICSGEITREEALKEIAKPTYPDSSLEKQDLNFVIKKFDISNDEFDRIMQLPIKTIHDYPNSFDKWELLRKLYWNLKRKK